MRTQTQKQFLTILPILLSLITATLYFSFRAVANYEIRLTGDIGFNTVQNFEVANRAIPTPAPPPVKTPASAPLPVPSLPLENTQNTELKLPNLTDHWISERSGKSYFISEMNGSVEMFENDARHKSVKIGNGWRNKNEIVLQFYSTLDEVNGTLKLKVSEDGKSMTGRFTALDDPNKENDVRIIRSTS